MSCAPKNRPILVTDSHGVTVEAIWNPNGEYEQDDGSIAHGYWATEAGWILPHEATGWQSSLGRALKAHGG